MSGHICPSTDWPCGEDLLLATFDLQRNGSLVGREERTIACVLVKFMDLI